MAENDNVKGKTEDEIQVIELSMDQLRCENIKVNTKESYKLIVKIPEFTISH